MILRNPSDGEILLRHIIQRRPSEQKNKREQYAYG